MLKDTLTLKIDQMAFGGEGLGTHKGKKIFVSWAVEGDLVEIELVENKRDYGRGKIVKILETSPARTTAPCPYFLKCGGCQWQHVEYQAQLEFKQELLSSNLKRIGKISNPKLLEPIACDFPFHYRNRIRLQVNRDGELGFFKPHSKELVAIEKCEIADHLLNEKISEAKQLAQKLSKQESNKRHEIEIRLDAGKVKIEADPENETQFSQVNPSQNEKLITRVLEILELTGKENVLELYAGNGNFSFSLAKKAKEMIAVESNPASVDEAKQKLEKQHIHNLRFIESTAFRYLQTSPSISFDRLLLDPPRSGSVECLEAMAKLKCQKILYISCDPSTLSRDLNILSTLGYQHEFSQVIDMFPQTYHIESINLLSLKNQH